MLDGLEDAYEIATDGARRSMGTFGEDCAEKFQFTRAMQDEFAIASVTRALEAAQSRAFANEIAPVDVSTRNGLARIETDEGPRRIKVDKIPALKPAFKKNGTITAASSSSINDGAAALVVMSASEASARGLKPFARVVGCAAHVIKKDRVDPLIECFAQLIERIHFQFDLDQMADATLRTL